MGQGHSENDQWAEWRAAVERTGYTAQLARAAEVLIQLESMSAEEFERLAANRSVA